MTGAHLTALGKTRGRMSQMYNDSNAANYTWGLLGLKSEIMVTSKTIMRM